jgi:helix-turn-helix protein
LETGRVTARELWVVAESVHAVTYFAPAALESLRQTGLKGFWAGYFAARAAPLGAVGAAPVAAAFYNFDPAMVRRAVPSCWAVVEPAALTVRRAEAAAGVLSDICTAGAREALVAALPILRRAVAGCDGEGRPLTGANRELWPTVQDGLRRRAVPEATVGLAEAWQACTTLREHRGDGHVAALLVHGLSGLEAHLLAAGALGVPPDVLRNSRGWTEAHWAAGIAGLAGRGLLRSDGTATDAGRDLRRRVEAMTDDLAVPPFAVLSDAEMADLHRALLGCAAEIQGSGLYPFPNPIGLPALASSSHR